VPSLFFRQSATLLGNAAQANIMKKIIKLALNHAPFLLQMLQAKITAAMWLSAGKHITHEKN
jgi:hypothetical protein